jgi:hypothetical protein
MGTGGTEGKQSAMTRDRASPGGQQPAGRRSLSLGVKAALVGLVCAIGFFSWLLAAGISRYRQMMADDPAVLAASGWMPAGFEHDTSAEANAFRAACSRCHVLPSPRIYDANGWQASLDRMKALSAIQGVSIPQRQWDMATEYVLTNARPSRPPPVP